MEEDEDEEATGLVSLLRGDISFQQWSVDHQLSEIVQGADAEEELASEYDSDDEKSDIGGNEVAVALSLLDQGRKDNLVNRGDDSDGDEESQSAISKAIGAGISDLKRKRKHADEDDEDDPDAAEFYAAMELDKKRRRKRLFGQNKLVRRRTVLPEQLKDMFGEANMALARCNYDEVVNKCMTIIQQAPFVSEPYQTLALALEEKGDKERAFQFSFIAANLKPNDPEQWVTLAEQSLERNDEKMALECYSKGHRYAPGDLNILFNRARLNQKLGNLKKAMDDYEVILKELDPEESEQQLALSLEVAKLCHEQKDIDRGIAALQNAFQLAPAMIDANAVNLLAELYMAKDDFSSSLQIICNSCGITDPLASGEEEKVETSAHDTTAGSRAPQQVWQLPPSLPIDLRAKIIVSLIHLARTREAVAVASPVLEENAEHFGDVFLDVAEAFVACGHHAEALPYLAALVSTQRYNMAAVWLQYGQSLLGLKQLENAASAYSVVVSMAPTHLDARLTLADLLQQLGHHDDAIAILEADVTAAQDETSQQEESASGAGVSGADAVAGTASSSTGSTGASASTSAGTGTTPAVTAAQLAVQQAVQAVMTQDVRVIHRRCELLHAQKKFNDYAENALTLMKFYLRAVYHKRDIHVFGGIAKCRKRAVLVRSGMMENVDSQDPIAAKEQEQENQLSSEEWYQLLYQLCCVLAKLNRFATFQHLSCAAAASIKLLERAPDKNRRNYDLSMLCASAAYLNGNFVLAWEHIRAMAYKAVSKTNYWNIYARISYNLPDIRHQKFELRVLLKNPDNLPLLIINAHHCMQNGTFKFAVVLYQRALERLPQSAFLHLCLGLCFLQLSTVRFTQRPYGHALEAFAFLYRYKLLRGECQESMYNLGRAFHHVGLLGLAANYYEKVLQLPAGQHRWPRHGSSAHEASILSAKGIPMCIDQFHPLDLRAEASFNLSRIYLSTGLTGVAQQLLRRYCAF
ncbi:general transcription factor 3C polypeptide 3-like isoform X1 [Sycon ciliatum]|uniref:general transcription factor 3C polypeptide 3-like isoform X1 n=1 Tax=Sycon ciliatum TaxID=27933 RepID=UPI0031F72243